MERTDLGKKHDTGGRKGIKGNGRNKRSQINKFRRNNTSQPEHVELETKTENRHRERSVFFQVFKQRESRTWNLTKQR